MTVNQNKKNKDWHTDYTDFNRLTQIFLFEILKIYSNRCKSVQSVLSVCYCF